MALVLSERERFIVSRETMNRSNQSSRPNLSFLLFAVAGTIRLFKHSREAGDVHNL
jgi:hypothetical protein